MEIKHDIWVPIRAEIEAQKLTQAQLARTLQIHQPDARRLLRGQIARFSITRLLQFADRLHLAVTLTVAPPRRSLKRAGVPRGFRSDEARNAGNRRVKQPARRDRQQLWLRARPFFS